MEERIICVCNHFLFVCLGLTSLLNIWGHIATVPVCSSGTQYTDTGPTCRCAFHWCGTSHWNTQLPILMSWVRPDREILPRPSTQTPANAQLNAVIVVNNWKLSRKYRGVPSLNDLAVDGTLNTINKQTIDNNCRSWIWERSSCYFAIFVSVVSSVLLSWIEILFGKYWGWVLIGFQLSMWCCDVQNQ